MANVSFRAIIPDMQSALKFGGTGCRVTLDVPESDLQLAVPLIALRNVVLRVTVEVDGAQVPLKGKTRKALAEPEVKPHGKYWQCWFKPNADGAAAIFSTLLVDSLALDDGPVTHFKVQTALRAALGVESLSREASPELFESYLKAHQLHGLITQSRQIVARLQEEEQRD